jgi:hypothetical protein
MLRRIFGPEKKKLHELSNFYTSSNAVRINKSRKIRWIG